MKSAEVLEGAIAQPLRIGFYIDGYHAYLLAKELVGIHLVFLDRIERNYKGLPDIFDRSPSPEKLAEIVTGLLLFAEDKIVFNQERLIRVAGGQVIDQATVNGLTSPYRSPLVLGSAAEQVEIEGRVYVEPRSHGTVFCPRYDNAYLVTELDGFINELTVDGGEYAATIAQLKGVRAQILRGDFDKTQRFYDALADDVGGISQRGVLRVSRNTGRRPVEEKGVDGDLLGSLAADAYSDASDVFVLLTNDSDHAPLAERLMDDGKRVAVVGYTDRPASALRRAVGNHNVLNLLTNERDFDFSPVWLRNADAHSLAILEDIRMQWAWWKANGMISD